VIEPPSPEKPLVPPEPIVADHVLDSFDSGVPVLDEWLRRRARRNEDEGASRTFVCCEDRRVVGYYCLSAGSLLHRVATSKVRRNMPEPIPVVLLGRLAIDRRWQGRGLGADLLRDAVLRVISAADTVGVRALLVHALSADAKVFYEKNGFRESPAEADTLMITLDEAQRMLR
jgi:GNAT superfamily N-acetyltransferase